MRSKLKNFLFEWLILSLSIGILGALLGYIIHNEYQIVTEREKQHLTAAAEATDSILTLQLEKTNAALSIIQKSMTPGWQEQTYLAILLKDRIKTLEHAMTNIRSLFIVEASGAIISSGMEDALGQNASDWNYAYIPDINPRPDVLYVSPPFKSNQGSWIIALSRVIFKADGEYGGVVTATLDLQYFHSILNTARYAPNSWVRIVHGGGKIILWVPQREEMSGKNLALPDTFFSRHMQSGRKTSLFEGLSYSTNEESILVLHTVQSENLRLDIPIVLGIGRNKNNVYTDWQNNFQNYCIIYGILFLAGAMCLLISQRWRYMAWFEAQRMEAQLKRTRIELESFFNIAPNLLSIADFSGTCRKLNPAWKTIMGQDTEELEGKRCLDLVHPEDKTAVKAAISMLREGNPVSNMTTRFQHKDGSYRFLEWFAAAHDELIYMAAHDVTERKEQETHLYNLAYYDRLTGLPNRALFFDRISQTLSNAKRNNKHFGILFIDLDGFKIVNDEHGHDAGDIVLKSVSERLQSIIRATDTVARIGGDEFVLILHELDEVDDATFVAQKILDVIAPEIALSATETCRIGASIGISIFPENGMDIDSLLLAADMAMYQSKKRGKHSYIFASDDMKTDINITLDNSYLTGISEIDEQHQELSRLANSLNKALTEKERDITIIKCIFKLFRIFSEYHFLTEKKLMQKYKYPHQTEHDASHADFLEIIQHWKTETLEEDDQYFFIYIKKWLFNHILTYDKPLGIFLNQFIELKSKNIEKI